MEFNDKRYEMNTAGFLLFRKSKVFYLRINAMWKSVERSHSKSNYHNSEILTKF